MTAFKLGDEVINAIKKYAPYLGNVVSSVSPLGGVAVSLVEHALGVAPGDAPALTNALASDPDLQVKLETVERQIQQVDSSDREGARIANGAAPNQWIIPLLAIVFVTGFFGYLVMMMTGHAPSDTVAHQIFDALNSITVMIISYYFGSCHPNNR
jgi:hypothetical protein